MYVAILHIKKFITLTNYHAFADNYLQAGKLLLVPPLTTTSVYLLLILILLYISII